MRPREHSDQQLIDLAVTAISRKAGAPWSLADVARDSGVHAATYIKRFGSKKGLTLAISRAWSDSIPIAPATAEPVTELRGWVLASYGPFGESESIPGHMAALAADLSEPELREALARGWQAQERYVRTLLDAGADLGLLTRLPEAAAATLLAGCEGTVIRWFAEPHGSLTARLELLLDTLLTSWE